ncbi:acyltransferase family protein [uncultured Sphingomonas sp.]|uniref:acyltransferase family protein n=1 Tax=uncultured Sphingomonas sp. TaxID=158754 RepID=UPI0035CA5322
MRKTFGQILEENKGAGPGFDALRLALALAILLAHLASVGGTRGVFAEFWNLLASLYSASPPDVVLNGQATTLSVVVGAEHTGAAPPAGLAQPGVTMPLVLTHVPMFFALSGFLVSGSAFRTKKVGPFLALRFFRIFPALCVEVVLSAVLIGAFFTSLPLMMYFQDSLFWSYLGNILGIVQMELPGVIFSGSGDKHALNANLWTLPSEFYSYAVLAILMISTIVFNRYIYTIIFALVSIILLIIDLTTSYNPEVLSGSTNIYYFFVGVTFYQWRNHIPYNYALFVLSAVASYFLITKPYGVYLAPLFVAYVAMFIGLSRIPKSKILQSGDYSYGIYLYGFPISQALVQIFPALRNNFFGLAVPAILLTGLFSYFSWHLVEKKFLKLKKRFSASSAKITETLHPGTAG